MDLVIEKIIAEYGVADNSDTNATPNEVLFDDDTKYPIVMNFDVFDQEELDLVVTKLETVKEIENFTVEHDYNTRYKILIYTTANEYQLAEGLYLAGLTYKIHGHLYNLIDIRKGG